MWSTLRSLAASRALAWALVAAATVQLFLVTCDYAILGMDSYPAIASGLLRSPADVVTIFTSPAVPGRVPYAFRGFYRPITTISLGIDHALFGVDPRGYFVTQALLFGLSSLLFYELARRSIGAASVGPLLALVTFLLAPSHVETLAVVARRSEPLCAIFGLLALLVQMGRLERRRPWSLLAGFFTFLAVISKTTGVALIPVVFVLVFTSTRSSIVQRLRAALRATLPHLGAVVVAFAVQIAILGEVGGHIMSRPSGAVDRLPWALSGLARWLIVPQPSLGASPVTWLLLGAVGLGLVVTCVLVLRRGREEASHVVEASYPALVTGAVWLVALAALYGAVGLLQGWYVFVPAMAYALVVGGIGDALDRAARSDAAPARAAAATTLALAVAWTVWQARYSMLVGSYTAIDRASAVTTAYVEDLTARIKAAPDGSLLSVPAPPRKLDPQPGEWVLDGPLLLPEYAFASWVDCAFPAGGVEVHDRRDGAPTAPAHGVKIVFEP